MRAPTDPRQDLVTRLRARRRRNRAIRKWVATSAVATFVGTGVAIVAGTTTSSASSSTTASTPAKTTTAQTTPTQTRPTKTTTAQTTSAQTTSAQTTTPGPSGSTSAVTTSQS